MRTHVYRKHEGTQYEDIYTGSMRAHIYRLYEDTYIRVLLLLVTYIQVR
jgi:hypothetical protein